MKKLISIIGAVSLLLFACSKSPEIQVDPKPTDPDDVELIPIKLSLDMGTRATDTNFENGDQTGIYVVNYKDGKAGTLQLTGNHVDNMRFTLDKVWVPDTPIYWLDGKTHADFYCYYPYVSTELFSDITAYPFQVQTDQSKTETYKASDFLWGKTADLAPTPELINIRVGHALSNLKIVLKPGEGLKEEDLRRAIVSICGLKISSTINLQTGLVSPSGEAEEIQPLKVNGYFRALIIPQTIENADLIKVTLDNYTYLLSQSMTFVPGKMHTCTVTINKINDGINIGIDGWETDDNDYGGIVG